MLEKNYNQTWGESGNIFFYFYALFNVTSLFTYVDLSLKNLSDKQYFMFSSLIIYNLAEAGDLKFML